MYNWADSFLLSRLFWSYIGFAQYMLMWYANLPEEVFWYKERLQGAWGPLLLALAILHFLVPFFVLIPREAKSNPKFLSLDFSTHAFKSLAGSLLDDISRAWTRAAFWMAGDIVRFAVLICESFVDTPLHEPRRRYAPSAILFSMRVGVPL